MRASFLALAGSRVTLKSTNSYNIEKHVKHTLISKVNYACCVHITAFGLTAYQRILVLFIHETKAYKISFLFTFLMK